MIGNELRAKRAAAGIDGHTVCLRAKISRSRLSDVELDRVTAKLDELQRIASALDSIISERTQIAALAAEHGLSLAGVGL
jgi:transcriptional regulator with XRE-family HTH domain